MDSAHPNTFLTRNNNVEEKRNGMFVALESIRRRQTKTKLMHLEDTWSSQCYIDSSIHASWPFFFSAGTLSLLPLSRLTSNSGFGASVAHARPCSHVCLARFQQLAPCSTLFKVPYSALIGLHRAGLAPIGCPKSAMFCPKDASTGEWRSLEHMKNRTLCRARLIDGRLEIIPSRLICS